ncbi:alpha/beta fold hydrolase [Pedococcus sp. KACC 23699]|uniref:Alpha/beta fold hydrolase n=1 Tax=Pedococcus sp. KACC 23699 TaxID=3149228 RepID=A0AAU7JYM2_9MICO
MRPSPTRGTARLDDGTAIAYAVTGHGPTVVHVPGWVSHLDLGWAVPAERRFYEGLATGRTLVRYDRPGCGLSGGTDRTDVAELELEVLAAVAEEVGTDRFDLVGASFGAPLAVRWAARHPSSVGRLVLYGGWVHGDRVASPTVRQHVLGLVDSHWGLASDVLTDIFAPEADAGFRAVFARYQRDSASAAMAHQLLAACYAIDVSEDLGRIMARTTVIHRQDDRAVPLSEGQRLAAGIAGATLTVLPGRTHLPFAGDTQSLLGAIRTGLGLPALDPLVAAPALTPRQTQVAQLVSRGWSNRQIAEELVISERSAESHVERIRTRLGFRSRSQVAAWYVASNPPS